MVAVNGVSLITTLLSLRCRSETCCTRLAENTGCKDAKTCQKIAIWAPWHNFFGLYLRN